MINEKQARKYCGEDISAIENYEQAVADQARTWDLHHKLEIQGQFTNSPELLKKCGLYYGVPASQLVFITHSEHTRLHNFGRPKSEETKRKITEALNGRPKSDETKRKISEAKTGERNHNFGKPLSQETKRKISEALKGRRHSEEARRRMSEAKKGKTPWNKGKVLSEETKRKLSEARKEYWRKLKENES